jgi:amino acid adenylation domain-containing protein
VTELTEDQRRLVEQRLARRPTARAAAPAIPAIAGEPPLSDGQRALLYEYDQHPDAAGYNVCHRYRIHGPLDAVRLETALRAAVARHEALHLTFSSPRRSLTPDVALSVRAVDTDPEGLEAIAEAEASTRIDLRAGPLVRAVVARLGDDDHGLVLTMHHVSCDAASLSVLWRDLSAAYAGHPVPVPGARYADHAAWRAASLADDEVDAVVDGLADAPAPTLPYAPGATADGFVARSDAVGLAGLPGAAGRPFPALLAVFAGLLQHLTDEDEAVLGVTSSTRDHPSVADTVGYFLNVLPLRLRMDPARPVEELVAAADRALAAALDHRHVPYARVAAGVRRRGGGDPARVLLVLEEDHGAALEGCVVDTRVVFNGTAAGDLTVFVRRQGDGVFLSAEHAGSAMRGVDAARLLDAYARLLHQAGEDPARPFADLVVAEPDQDTAPGPDGHPPTVTDAILGHARLTPDAPAVRCGHDRLTYGALVGRARVIADALGSAGVRRGDRVGLLLPRSTDLVAAVVATHLLGAAYVPVDPSYPDERVARILSVGRPVAVVTATAGTAPAGLHAVALDRLGSDTDGSLPGAPGGHERGPDPDDPAYVIFTSGSTGVPRGVLVRHRQLAASTFARFVAYPEPPGRFLLVSSFGFDSSVAGLFWTLTAGGELVVPTDDEAHDPDRLLTLASRAAATHVLTVPTLLGALLDRRASALATLRQAIVAGEACPPAIARAAAAALPDCRLANEYGPTEATVWATVRHVVDAAAPTVPIGAPVPGASVRVADRWGRTRPWGAAGELLVGGTGVTDGYLDDPTATADRFLTGADGRRWYRTGDLARRGDDGSYEFLGRLDGQLNVGGHRIEPEEIEAAILTLPGVRAAVVRAERPPPADPLGALARLGPDAAALLAESAADPEPAARLAALLAERTGVRTVLAAHVETDALGPDDVRRGLVGRLPRHLIPTRIAVVPALPRTPHGKVDRTAVVPLGAAEESASAASPPRGDRAAAVHPAIRAAWEAVLPHVPVEPDTDFFDAGGDSLTAVALMSRIEAGLGVRFPISALLGAPTPARLSALVQRSVRATPHIVELRAAVGIPLFLLPTGTGHLLSYAPLVQALPADLPIYGFVAPGSDGISEPLASVEEHARLFLPELLAVQPSGPYRLLGWSTGGLFAHELGRMLRDAGEDVAFVGLVDTLFPGFEHRVHGPATDRYRTLLAESGLRGVSHQLADGVRRRSLQLGRQARIRLARARHRPIDIALNEHRMTAATARAMAAYRPAAGDARSVLFAASDTDPALTVEPWSRLLPALSVVPLDGAHAGPRSITGPDRVDDLVEALLHAIA